MANDPFSFANDWMAFQKKYADSLSALNPQSFGGAQPAPSTLSNPWGEAVEQWWKGVSPGATSDVEDFYRRLIDQGKNYFQMAEQMSNLSQAADASATQWQDATNQALEKMKALFSGTETAGLSGFGDAMSGWSSATEQWRNNLSSFMPGAFSMTGGASDFSGMGEPMERFLNQLLNMPGVGEKREEQADRQELIRLTLAYQQAMQAYMKAHNAIAVKSIEKLQKVFSSPDSEAMKKVDSMKAVYDLWVDCCEEVYAEEVVTDEYVAIHGNVVNTLAALKQKGRAMMDETLEAFNQPTRKELNSVHQRMHQMRRENRILRADVEALKTQLEALSKPAPRKRAASRTTKATTTKAVDKK